MTKQQTLYKCQTCPDHPEFDGTDAAREHLVSVHKIDPATTTFNQQMVAHMDAQKWFRSDYLLTSETVTLFKSVITPRQKNDPMRL